MTDYEKELAAYEQQLREQQLNAQTQNLGQQQMEIAMANEEKGMAHEQLEVNEILDKAHHLLSGDYLERNAQTGYMEWKKPQNNDQIVLSPHGINYLMTALQFYLHKVTLLSNYDEDTINNKMLDLSITIQDDVFMEYDKMFLHPTNEECVEELEKRIAQKLEARKKFCELYRREYDETLEYAKIMQELEPRYDKELLHIKEQKMKNKLKRFESLMRFIQDTIHSAYMRAWKGQERTTLRQHIHITENKGINPYQHQQQGGWNPFNKK